jgi:hypothetical protein
VLQATRDPVSDTEVPSETMKPPSEARCVVDRDMGKGAVAARRHGRIPEGGGGLFAIEGSPETPKPADGEPSETEPVRSSASRHAGRHDQDVDCKLTNRPLKRGNLIRTVLLPLYAHVSSPFGPVSL